jgi:hypothetical protein
MKKEIPVSSPSIATLRERLTQSYTSVLIEEERLYHDDRSFEYRISF